MGSEHTKTRNSIDHTVHTAGAPFNIDNEKLSRKLRREESSIETRVQCTPHPIHSSTSRGTKGLTKLPNPVSGLCEPHPQV